MKSGLGGVIALRAAAWAGPIPRKDAVDGEGGARACSAGFTLRDWESWSRVLTTQMGLVAMPVATPRKSEETDVSEPNSESWMTRVDNGPAQAAANTWTQLASRPSFRCWAMSGLALPYVKNWIDL